MVQEELNTVWEKMLEKLRETIAEAPCQRWFEPIRPLSLEDGTLRLGTPNGLSKTYIETRYIPLIQDAGFEVLGQKLSIELESLELKPENDTPYNEEERLFPLQPNTVEEKPAAVYGASPQQAPASELHMSRSSLAPIPPGDHSSLNPKHTFDTFVIGSSNQMAHAAALAVAESPGKVYNPLFLYGGVGLGKTHLMHAIGNQVLSANSNMRVLYISSEKFVNEFIDTLRDGKPEAFRQKYRQIDVLLVDDLQFLSEKERTQEEFFHTFNALYDAGKAIILSSDRPPKEIKTLEDRLRSRFEGGLMADIQAPNYETRCAILQKKALLEHLDVPDDVIRFIASRIDTNIRELEGALTRVAAFASMRKENITTELATEAMKNIYQMQKKDEITLEMIQEMTSSYFNIPLSEILSRKRTRDLVMARQVGMYLCRTLTENSLETIATAFHKDNHTTVLHATDKITKERITDAQLDRSIKELIERIQKI